jgi:tetratricopeptide (TPR) repeat protein
LPTAGTRPQWTNRPGAGGGGQQWPATGTGPQWANRPGAGGGGEQWPAAGTRPQWANRPGAGGSGEQWPVAGGIGDRWPNAGQWANRPGAGAIGDRWPNAGNRPNWSNGSNWVNNGAINQGNNLFNQNITQNNLNVNNNQFNNVNGRPWGYDAYHANWADWHSGSWNNWNHYPAAWYTAGAAAGVGASMLWGAGANYTYSNPFYVESPVVESVPALDYSQPIQVPTPVSVSVDNSSYATSLIDTSADDSVLPVAAEAQEPAPEATTSALPPEPTTPTVPPEATRHFDIAREAFKTEEYDRALTEVDEAIKLLPKDATLHEFRALVLFAQKKYKDAAAGIYAVLAVGPGWNWETMSGLYAKRETYTKQLRALEAYTRDNPSAPDGHFLLAYQYLVLGSVPAATTQLKEFEKEVPSDQLAPQLVKAFTESPDTSKPKPEEG